MVAGSRIPIVVLGDAGEIFYEMAVDMIHRIQANKEAGRETVFICPVGQWRRIKARLKSA